MPGDAPPPETGIALERVADDLDAFLRRYLTPPPDPYTGAGAVGCQTPDLALQVTRGPGRRTIDEPPDSLERSIRTLIFVHGRGQQGREPDALRRRWAAGLNKGLTAAGRDAMDTATIQAIGFPFYGDVLWAAVVQGRAAVPDVAALSAVQQVDPGLPDAVNRRQVAVLQAMARELGFQSAVVPEAAFELPTSALLRGLLEWVANHSGVDEAVIRGFLRDVSAYLELPGCRPAVQDVVRPPLLADPDCVLVGHSLGGVICAELLAEDEVRARTAVFVAVGAPLGLDAVTAGMRPRGSARPTSPWINVYDPRDWVALGSPLPQGDGLREQLAVANPRSYEHSIEHYLAHPEVATIIADALDGAT